MNEKLQQKQIELQMLSSQIKQLQKQLQKGVSQSAELQKIKDNFDELKKVENDTEIMASIAPGIFVKANIKEPQQIMLGVGNGVVVEKNVDEAKILLDKQINELSDMLEDIKKEIQESIINARKLQQDVQALSIKNQDI